ncbi:MAG: hypothetical protein N3J91_08925 [Verrucomicrobiae bacterium]|nr:hypothetical protein [Verrucomicrobiae bacterium]
MAGPQAWGGWLAAALMVCSSPLWGQTPAEAAAAVPSRRLVPFTLADQYGTNHVIRLPLPRLTFITVADKSGAAEVNAWVNPLHLLYGRRLDILGVANVSAAPRWFQGEVRRHFRRNYKHPVLLDWEGKVTASLGASQAAITVILALPDGSVIYQHHGPATAPALERLLQTVGKVLQQQPGN